MNKKIYLVAKEKWGIPYYLHDNGEFYNAIINGKGKIYKTLKGAQKKAKEISTFYPGDLVEVISVGENKLLIDDSKVVDTYENVTYTERMNYRQQEMYDRVINTLTPTRIIQGAIQNKEKPMEYLLAYIRDMGMSKTSGRLVAETILDWFGIDNKN